MFSVEFYQRVRHACHVEGLSPLTARMRRDARRAMEKALARLQAQKAAAND
jgi:hypothetical protein